MRILKVLGVLLVLTTSLAVAADAPVPGPFRAFVVSDERFEKGNTRGRADRMHDLVTDAGLYPAVAVFARTVPNAADAPVSKLIGALNALAAEKKGDKLAAFAVFLTLTKEYPEVETEVRDAKAKEVRDLAAQLKAANVPLALAANGSDAAKAWGLADTADVTVVFYHRMEVVQRWQFAADKPPTEDDLKAIAAAVRERLK